MSALEEVTGAIAGLLDTDPDSVPLDRPIYDILDDIDDQVSFSHIVESLFGIDLESIELDEITSRQLSYRMEEHKQVAKPGLVVETPNEIGQAAKTRQ